MHTPGLCPLWDRSGKICRMYDQARAVQIYALCCPDTGRVRYVGKANDAAKRMASHLRDAKRRRTPVYSWIRSLQGSGLVPAMRVLASTWDWPETERAIIAQFRAEGELLNLADGGDEPKCPKSVQVENGRKLMEELRSNPLAYAARSYLRDAGQLLRELRKIGREDRANELLPVVQRLKAMDADELGYRLSSDPRCIRHFPKHCHDRLRALHAA